jgi:hypothetical protein
MGRFTSVWRLGWSFWCRHRRALERCTLSQWVRQCRERGDCVARSVDAGKASWSVGVALQGDGGHRLKPLGARGHRRIERITPVVAVVDMVERVWVKRVWSADECCTRWVWPADVVVGVIKYVYVHGQDSGSVQVGVTTEVAVGVATMGTTASDCNTVMTARSYLTARRGCQSEHPACVMRKTRS